MSITKIDTKSCNNFFNMCSHVLIKLLVLEMVQYLFFWSRLISFKWVRPKPKQLKEEQQARHHTSGCGLKDKRSPISNISSKLTKLKSPIELGG